ncbi:MAG: DUF1810 domain-containing protein [Eggerthellaceae bacterium]|jgi:uncharacterized protein (DUF1810 family)
MAEHDLSRFLDAQERDYETALGEIRAGRKRTHWMWYIFPQIDGLGRTPTARYYAIKDLGEARAYLAHPVLGPRLLEISQALLALRESDPHRIFGSPDDLKLCSCMTLFETADAQQPVFRRVLEKYYNGRRDDKTLHILESQEDNQANRVR